MLKVLQLAFIHFVTLAALSGCLAPPAGKESVLIIGIERLKDADVDCSQSSGHSESGFDLLCREAFRFHHTWTENTQSLPNLAAILAGPSSLTANRDFLSNDTNTLAEMASENGWYTGLWTSGPPFLRSSGIGQGFQTFEDHWIPSNYRLSRPLQNISESFLDWAKDRPPFFAVLTVSGLNEPWSPTVNEFGEKRPESIESQIEEIDTRLSQLFSGLKERKLWDKTLVVVIGLSGRSDESRGLLPTLDLHAENTQVLHFVKPPAGYFDVQLVKNYDKDISVGDWNETLTDFFTGRASPPVHSLYPFLKTGAQPDGDRILLQVGVHQTLNGNRYRAEGLRHAHFFVVNNAYGPQVYNSLVDSDERTLWTEPSKDLLELSRKMLRRSSSPASRWSEEIDPTLLWNTKNISTNFNKLYLQARGTQLEHLLLYLTIKAGVEINISHPCEEAFRRVATDPLWKTCTLPLVLHLRRWVDDPGDPTHRIELSRELSNILFLESAARVEMSLGRPWGLNYSQLENLWVTEKILRQSSAQWTNEYQEIRRSLERKPVF